MDDLREGLNGPLADAYQMERWRQRRAAVRARVQELRDADRRDHWLKAANQQLQGRLDAGRRDYPLAPRPVERKQWTPPPIPEVVEAPKFEAKKARWVQ